MQVQPFSQRIPIGSGWRSILAGMDVFYEYERLKKRRPAREIRRQFREQRGKRFVTTLNPVYGTYAAMTVTNLQSLANDATDVFAGWQSARVSNLVTLADDYEIIVDLSTANTAPANDSAAYVYLVPWVSTDGGTTWITGGNFGTATLPTGTEGTANISDPNSMRGPRTIPYKIATQRLETWFTVSGICQTPGLVPDAWSLAIRNCTGAALSTGCVVAYRPITWTNT